MYKQNTIRYRLDLVTAATTEPVTLAEAKNHLRLDGTDYDTDLNNMIVVARDAAESYTSRALVTQTWKVFYDRFPDSYYDKCGISYHDSISNKPFDYYERNYNRTITLPKAPLQSVTHIKTYADDDTATTFSSSNYQVTTYSGDKAPQGRIRLRDGQVFPSFTRNADGVEIQFVAGYGAPVAVPKQIKQGMLSYIAYLFENRGDCEGKMELPHIVKMLFEPYKIMKL